MDGARLALLVLNETGLEYRGPAAETKRRCMLRLLARELAAVLRSVALGCKHISTRWTTWGAVRNSWLYCAKLPI